MLKTAVRKSLSAPRKFDLPDPLAPIRTLRERSCSPRNSAMLLKPSIVIVRIKDMFTNTSIYIVFPRPPRELDRGATLLPGDWL